MTVIREHWFDMDHTLIDNDCDVSWKQFLVARGLAPADALDTAERFFRDYQAGCLDTAAFAGFQLAEFAGRTPEEMAQLAREHFEALVREKVYPRALEHIRSLRKQGIPTAILTSTNEVVARPVAEYFGVDRLFGTRIEMAGGRFTDRYAGENTLGPAKVETARADTARRGVALGELAYYGDSINDRFILEAVGQAFAANPDGQLSRLAAERGWTVINFRE